MILSLNSIGNEQRQKEDFHNSSFFFESLYNVIFQQTVTCLEAAVETLGKGVKNVQS